MIIPKYRSHKVVEAAKIADDVTVLQDGTANLILEWDSGTTVVNVSAEYLRKHDPKRGGYWVRYPDGYESWSPAEAFEGGYTRGAGAA